MSNEHKVYLEDIKKATHKIERYTKGISYEKFAENDLLIDGVVRNLEIIGEAVKRIPTDIKKRHQNIEWKKVAGLRDILIHEYSGINVKIIWDIIINKLPHLKETVNQIIKNADIDKNGD